MTARNISPIAVQRPAYRKRWRRLKPYGLAVHTSGRGIVERANRKGVEPIRLALEWYRKKAGPHYVIGYDGTIFQIQSDWIRGAHIGTKIGERLSYLSGRWVNKVSTKPLDLWTEKWAHYKSPQHLFPGRSPNGAYLGVEMIPLLRANKDGTWFTIEQHRAVGRLYEDLCRRHGWPKTREQSPRLIGHEDVSAYSRWQRGGGWDPGALRVSPRFDWGRIFTTE